MNQQAVAERSEVEYGRPYVIVGPNELLEGRLEIVRYEFLRFSESIPNISKDRLEIKTTILIKRRINKGGKLEDSESEHIFEGFLDPSLAGEDVIYREEGKKTTTYFDPNSISARFCNGKVETERRQSISPNNTSLPTYHAIHHHQHSL